MSGRMRPKQAKLVVSFLFWAFLLVLSSATKDLLVVAQCKNQCKHDLHNMKECDRCEKKMMMTMMMMMDQEEPFLEDDEGIHQRCMTACSRTIQEMMATEKQEEGRGYGPLQTKCSRKCTSSYTPGKRCISQCFRSMAGKKMDNEVICESSCTILQEKPLIVRCTRVCHESTPGAVRLGST